MKVAVIALIIIVIGIFGFYIYNKNIQKNMTASVSDHASQVYSTSSMKQDSTNPATNNSDQQLDNDLNSVDTKLNSVNTEQSQIDSGLNQTAPSLTQ